MSKKKMKHFKSGNALAQSRATLKRVCEAAYATGLIDTTFDSSGINRVVSTDWLAGIFELAFTSCKIDL